MTELAARLAKLSPAQLALLDQRVRQLQRPDTLAPIPRRTPADRHRLTLDQERIWLIHQFDPDEPAYNVFFSSRMYGRLDVAAFERAVNAVIDRHEVLRTTFERDGFRPVQVVHAAMPVTVDLIDLSGVPAQERDTAMEEAVQREIRRPFDLATGPLLRIALLRMGPEDHIMLGTVDHLVWDRASLGIFESELAHFYTAYVTGDTPDLPDLEIQYADYAEWQPEWIEREVRSRHLPYWKRQLDGASLVLELPTDRPRPPVQTFNGARYHFRISAELTEGIRELARREDVTVNVALLAAWQLLLHRLTGEQDIVVGTTSSTRSRPETEPLIGYFLTMLPLRTTVRPDMTFRELMRAARATMVGSLDYHDLPFGVLLDELDLDRDPSRTPVYQSTFIFVDFRHEKPVTMPGLRLEALMFDNHTAKDDITVGFFDADEFWGLLEYNTDLFSEATVARIWGHLEELLRQVVVAPDLPVAQVPLVGAGETEQLLRSWNETRVPREPGQRVEQLIRARAAAHPDVLAVVCDAEKLSYAELVGRAERLAGQLRQRGAGREDVVGVCLDRRADLVVALVAVLMTGAAYLPLDPHYPPARLATMTGDAPARLLLTQFDLLDAVAGCTGEVVCLDEPMPSAPPLTRPAEAGAESLAYVIYTSGSTGRPKGVEITHRSLVNLLLAMIEDLGLAPDDRWAAVTSVSFDIAGLELFAPLLAGATVLLIDQETAGDGRALAAAVADGGVTVMQATPATWHLLLESGWRNDGSLRVLTGGEALPPSLAAKLVTTPGMTFNVYGPTETTIWSTADRVDDGTDPVTIGRPLANTQVYVLDERLNPVPAGVTGDLYIGGDGLARGYRGRPAETAARFVPDHLGGRPGARLYATGDLVRWRSDGKLVFLGRNDGQVKLRGYRIEVGEIEARLDAHPAVRRSVVLIREDRPGDRRLVAYVRVVTQVSEPALREHLRATLPEYMVPAAFVTVEEFPLTPSGKVDRKALPAASSERSTAGYVAPRDPVEARVARIWEDVLGVSPVGVHDQFFDLGGHSLLVLKLIVEIEREFGTQLPMAAIFQGATVELFARMLREGYQEPTRAHLVQLRGGTGTPVFFAHPAGSEVVCYTPFAQALTPPDRPVYAIASPPPVAGALPWSSFDERAAEYARLVRAAQPDGPYVLAGWCYGGVNAFSVARQLERDGAEVSVVLVDAHPPQLVGDADEPSRASIVEALAQNLQWDYAGELRSLAQLEAMTEEEHLDYLLALARAHNYLPPDAGRDQIAGVLDLWVANLRLLWRYEPDPLAGPVTLIRAADEPESAFGSWAGLTTGGLSEHAVDGNHYTVMRDPQVQPVADLISEVLKLA
ncbi:amino acid adenylation domain-containing protein [Micromonospora zamorensis]|uniref:non-ribosomal peptide synthetase n=1 Tax=Micromonospora zamorensis TaxID=709883 RepID=UPI0033D79E40